MKPELEMTDKLISHEVTDEYCLIEEKFSEANSENIWKIIEQTKQPIYSIFLAGRQILIDLKVTSKINGKNINLSEFLYEKADVVRVEEAAYIKWELLPDIFDITLTDEYKNWLLLLVNSNLSIPRAKGIGVYHPKNIYDIFVILHEMKHVELGHEKDVDMKSIKGAKLAVMQEQDASYFAMIDFKEICNILGLSVDVVVKAKRVADAMLFSYIVSLNNYHGESTFTDSNLNLTSEEKQMIQKFIYLRNGS